MANRLTAINYTANGNRTEFSYDGKGRRVKIVEKAYGTVTSTKQFVYVGATMAEERNASGTVTKQFYPQGMSILSGYSTTGNFYYTRDHLGSVRELLSSTGTVVSRLNYDPYGNATVVSGTVLPDFQYAGMYAHLPSGLNVTLFRAYDPNTARWLSRDPIAERGGINLYDYVRNSPLDFTDPIGDTAVQVGVSGTMSGGGRSLTGSGGAAVDGCGNVAAYLTFGGGVAPPQAIGGVGGVTVQGSNALKVSDLGGIFLNGTGGIGDAEGGASADVFGGLSPDGVVVGGGMTGGEGIGDPGFVGGTYTIVIPLFNINSILNFFGLGSRPAPCSR